MTIRRPNNRNLCPEIMTKINKAGYETVGEFAEAKGIAKVTVGRYADCNETHQNLETLKRTADALGISIDGFVKLLLGKNTQNRPLSS